VLEKRQNKTNNRVVLAITFNPKLQYV
jgi:hypothetical protein